MFQGRFSLAMLMAVGAMSEVANAAAFPGTCSLVKAETDRLGYFNSCSEFLKGKWTHGWKCAEDFCAFAKKWGTEEWISNASCSCSVCGALSPAIQGSRLAMYSRQKCKADLENFEKLCAPKSDTNPKQTCETTAIVRVINATKGTLLPKNVQINDVKLQPSGIDAACHLKYLEAIIPETTAIFWDKPCSGFVKPGWSGTTPFTAEAKKCYEKYCISLKAYSTDATCLGAKACKLRQINDHYKRIQELCASPKMFEQCDPDYKAPETKAPETKKPETEKPKTEKPKTEKPKTEKPKTEKPKTEKPKTEKPKTETTKSVSVKAVSAAGSVQVAMVLITGVAAALQ